MRRPTLSWWFAITLCAAPVWAAPTQLPTLATPVTTVAETVVPVPPVPVTPPLAIAANPPSAQPQGLPPIPSADTESQVFSAATDSALALTPAQIIELHKMLLDRQRAAATVPNPPRPVTSSVILRLSPGSTPPVIRIFQGMASTFTVVDRTGSPWPVDNVVAGNPHLFALSRLDGPQGSVFAITPLAQFGTSNIVLKLRGNPTPALLTIVAGQPVVDENTEVRVDAIGPGTHVLVQSLPPGTDARLLSVLDGVPPPGARPLTVSGAGSGTRAWLLTDGHMVIRTRMMLMGLPLSGVQATSSASGLNVYELPPSRELLGLDHNHFVRFAVGGI